MDTRTLQDLIGRYIKEFAPNVLAAGFTLNDLKRDLVAQSRLDYPLPLDINTAMLLELRNGIFPPTPPVSAYETAILADNPVGYWRLDDVSGSVAADLGSGANPGTYTSAGAPSDVATWVPRTPPAVASGLAVTMRTVPATGAPSYVALPPGPFSALDFSCELWAFVPAAYAATGYLVNAVAGSPQINLQLIANPNGSLTAHRRNPAGVIATLNVPPLTRDVWHHIVYTRLAGITLAIFVDGALVASTPDAVGGMPPASGIQIGGDDTGTRFADGMLDEVAIYGTALTPAQIAAHYAARA